jgi:hypothetical protein
VCPIDYAIYTAAVSFYEHLRVYRGFPQFLRGNAMYLELGRDRVHFLSSSFLADYRTMSHLQQRSVTLGFASALFFLSSVKSGTSYSEVRGLNLDLQTKSPDR